MTATSISPPVADILIEGGDIVAVGANLAPEGPHEVIDASGRLVVPGLINAHYHSHDTLVPRAVRGADAGDVAALHAADGRRTAARRRCARAPWWARWNRCAAASPPCRTCSVSPAQRGIHRRRPLGLSRSRDPRRVLADGLGRAAHRDGSPQGQPADRRPGDAGHQGAAHARPARLPRASVQAGIRRPARCTGRSRRLRRSAARRKCWKAVPSSPTSTTLPVYTHVYETRGQVLIARELFADHDGSLISYLEHTGLLNPGSISCTAYGSPAPRWIAWRRPAPASCSTISAT